MPAHAFACLQSRLDRPTNAQLQIRVKVRHRGQQGPGWDPRQGSEAATWKLAGTSPPAQRPSSRCQGPEA